MGARRNCSLSQGEDIQRKTSGSDDSIVRRLVFITLALTLSLIYPLTSTISLNATAQQVDRELYTSDLQIQVERDPGNILIDLTTCYLRGFVHEGGTMVKGGLTRGDSISCTIVRSGDYYFAFLMRDDEDGTEEVTIKHGNSVLGRAAAGYDDGQWYLFYVTSPQHVEKGDTFTLLTGNPVGYYRISLLMLLIEVPKRPPTEITDVEVFVLPQDDRGNETRGVQVSWITTNPADGPVEYGREHLEHSVIEGRGLVNNHRVVLHGLKEGETYRLRISGYDGTQRVSSKVLSFVVKEPRIDVGTVSSEVIPLAVEEPTGNPRENWPIASGVPFSQGALASKDHVRLLDAEGREIPAQFTVLSRWPDGSIKWLLVEFLASTSGTVTYYSLEYGNAVSSSLVGDPFIIRDTGSELIVSNGKLQLAIPRRQFALFNRVWLDTDGDGRFSSEEQIILSSEGVKLVDDNGEVYTCSPESVIIEERGPIRLTIKVEGHHTSWWFEKFFHCILRIHIYANQPYVKVTYTFGNDNLEQEMTDLTSVTLHTGLNLQGQRWAAMIARDTIPRLSIPFSSRLSSPSLLREIEENPENIVIDPQACELEGFVRESRTTVKGGLTPGDSISCAAKKSDRYYIAFLMRDDEDGIEDVHIRVNDMKIGIATAGNNDGKWYFFYAEQPLDLKEGDVISLVTGNPVGYYRISSLFLLKEVPGVTSTLPPVSANTGDVFTGAYLDPGERWILLQDHDDRYLLSSSTGERFTGWRAPGFAALRDSRWGLVVAVRDFWQTYPKGFEIDNNGITVNLLPELPLDLYSSPLDQQLYVRLYYWYRDGKYRLKRGVQISHDLLYYFYTTGDSITDPVRINEAFQNPLFAVAPPEVYTGSKVLGDVDPQVEGEFDRFKDLVERGFQRIVINREILKEYGFLNFGDWYGERRWCWGNLEIDLQWALALHFMRTGDLRYFWWGEKAAKHYGDIDVIHYAPLAGDVGKVYAHSVGHVGGYFDPSDFEEEGWWWGPHFVEGFTHLGHVWTQGNFIYYLLTGDKRYLESAQLTADWLASYITTNFDFKAERTVGWPLIAVMSAYQATGNPFYLNAARIFVRAAVKKQDPESGAWIYSYPVPGGIMRGNPSQTGILLTGLKMYNQVESSEEVKETIDKASQWLAYEKWDASEACFPTYHGPELTCQDSDTAMVAEGLAYGYRLSGDGRFQEVLLKALDKVFQAQFVYETWYTELIRMIPYALYDVKRWGITRIPPS